MRKTIEKTVKNCRMTLHNLMTTKHSHHRLVRLQPQECRKRRSNPTTSAVREDRGHRLLEVELVRWSRGWRSVCEPPPAPFPPPFPAPLPFPEWLMLVPSSE
ncbi:hypothetical protein GW17_00032541 [Ensete ventricosum]|nr:hypothetical protein GW17_00032541 [Ensete ventricosum]